MNSSITYIFITNVYPANGSTGVMQQIMTSLNITHIKGWKMNITWYWDVLTPATIVYNHSYIMGNSSTSARLWNATNSYTTYYWHVDVNDGHGNYLNTTYHFITAANLSGAGGVIGVIHDNKYWLLAVGLMLGIVVGMVIVVKKKKKNENQGDIGVF
jgi:LPXTG-motif cell wall-anchored protein